jgi:hypothetical protein
MLAHMWLARHVLDITTNDLHDSPPFLVDLFVDYAEVYNASIFKMYFCAGYMDTL